MKKKRVTKSISEFVRQRGECNLCGAVWEMDVGQLDFCPFCHDPDATEEEIVIHREIFVVRSPNRKR